MSASLEDEEDALALASGFTREKAPLWSLRKRPLDEVALTFYETKEDGTQTWLLTIDDDDLVEALSGFLLRNGACAFEHLPELDAHIGELERNLKAGLSPSDARDTALATFTSGQKAEFARQAEEARSTIARRIASGEFPDLKP